MLPLSCFAIGVSCALRSLTIIFFEKKKLFAKLIDWAALFFFFTISLVLFLLNDLDFAKLLTKKSIPLWILIGTLLALTSLRFIRKPKRGFLFFGMKMGAGLIFLATTLFIAISSIFLHFGKDTPVLKVVMTGEERKEWVEWKSPSSTFRKELLTTHEVVLETTDGKCLNRFYIYGDQVAIKAKVIRFKPIFNALGIDNLCQIEALYNDYQGVERHNTMPLKGYRVSMPESFLKRFFWKIWEKGFFQEKNPLFLKSATLESNYFPLIETKGKPFQGAYMLTVSEGGLSSLPLESR